MISSEWALAIIGFCLIMTLFLIGVPFMIDKTLQFCTSCHSGKFFSRKEPIEAKLDMRKGFRCSKCHILMEWLKLPDDLYNLWIRNHRIGFSLTYHMAFFFILIDLYGRTAVYLFVTYLTIGYLISILFGFFIIHIVTKRKILRRVAALYYDGYYEGSG